MNKQQQKQQVIQAFQERIQNREKPEMRISKSDKRNLIFKAIAADLIDAVGGTVLPIIGDIGSFFMIRPYFRNEFSKHDVDATEFIEEGGGGRFGFFTTQVIDAVSGFVPLFGDVLDLFFVMWTYKIYSTTRVIRNKDQIKIENYKKWRRKQEQLLQREIARIELNSNNLQNNRTKSR